MWPVNIKYLSVRCVVIKISTLPCGVPGVMADEETGRACVHQTSRNYSYWGKYIKRENRREERKKHT